MDKLIIQGGKRLEGEIQISGAKNAALPLMASTILAPGKHRLENVADLKDILTMAELLENLGAKVDRSNLSSKKILEIDTTEIKSQRAPYELVKTMRASILVLGPLYARFERAEVSFPGGCAIGARPVDQHLKGLEMLGAKISVEHGYIYAEKQDSHPNEITFDMVTVTGTENMMMASVFTPGKTVLLNTAQEPEVVCLAEYLNKMGAKIKGAGTDRIEVIGVDNLEPKTHRIIPDRIEAGTYLVAGAITAGDIVLKNAEPRHMEAVIVKLREAGVKIEESAEGLRVWRKGKLKGVDIRTAPYPGFPTDMQAQMMALLSIAEGSVSVITETIFENRFQHALELQRMGANIRMDGNRALVSGVSKLTGAKVMATDLRASASLVLAGLAAENTTEVSRVYHLDRGYERMEEKLNAVGAKIKRVKE